MARETLQLKREHVAKIGLLVNQHDGVFVTTLGELEEFAAAVRSAGAAPEQEINLSAAPYPRFFAYVQLSLPEEPSPAPQPRRSAGGRRA